MLLTKLLLVLAVLFLLRFPLMLLKFVFHIIRPFALMGLGFGVGMVVLMGSPSPEAFQLAKGAAPTASAVKGDVTPLPQAPALLESAGNAVGHIADTVLALADGFDLASLKAQLEDSFLEAVDNRTLGTATSRTKTAARSQFRF